VPAGLDRVGVVPAEVYAVGSQCGGEGNVVVDDKGDARQPSDAPDGRRLLESLPRRRAFVPILDEPGPARDCRGNLLGKGARILRRIRGDEIKALQSDHPRSGS
jgi:hypothetical protein